MTVKINVVTGPDSGASLNKDLSSIKAAILYGDRVVLHSVTATLFHSIASVPQLPSVDLLKLVMEMGTTLGQPIPGVNEENLAAIAGFMGMSSSQWKRLERSLPPTERKPIRELRELIGKMRNSTKDFRSIADGGGYKELETAVSSGFVTIEPYDPNLTDDPNKLLGFIDGVLNDQGAYPLFDELFSDIVGSAFKEGKLASDQRSVNLGRRAALSSGILRNLPSFEKAPMSEILDIRRELDKPLVRFRKAILEVSASAQTHPWSKEFDAELHDYLLKEVEPTLLEIEEIIQSKTYLRKLASNMTNVKEVVSDLAIPGLFFIGSQFTDSDIVKLLGTVAGLGSLAIQKYLDFIEEQKTVRKNPFYFVYSTRERLKCY